MGYLVITWMLTVLAVVMIFIGGSMVELGDRKQGWLIAMFGIAFVIVLRVSDQFYYQGEYTITDSEESKLIKTVQYPDGSWKEWREIVKKKEP